jgi:hypothetical protein
MLRALGYWKITDNSISIITDEGFCWFYRWLFNRAHYHTIKTQTPKHGAHINIIAPKIHGIIDCSKYNYLNGQEIYFNYDVMGNYGGFTRGFKNFWLDVFIPEAEEILKNFGLLNKQDGFEFFHISILNNKSL